MHYLYLPLTITVPAGTPASAPQVTPWPFMQGWVEDFEINVPPGHAGQTGIAITYCGTQIYPWALSGFLVPLTPRHLVKWNDQFMATQLSVLTYNTGRNPHTFYLRATLWPLASGPPEYSSGVQKAGPVDAPTMAKIAQLSGVVS